MKIIHHDPSTRTRAKSFGELVDGEAFFWNNSLTLKARGDKYNAIYLSDGSVFTLNREDRVIIPHQIKITYKS